jgi:hypothetical protein
MLARIMAQRPIELTALWGHGDAESCLSVSWRTWVRICRGETCSGEVKGCYAGKTFWTYWSFEDRKVCVANDEGGNAFRGRLEDLHVHDTRTGERVEPLTREEAMRAGLRPR